MTRPTTRMPNTPARIRIFFIVVSELCAGNEYLSKTT